MAYRTVYTEVEVDVDLNEFDTDDLIEELESRGHLVSSDTGADHNELLMKIWELRRLGKPHDQEVGELIYRVLGKIV